MHQKVFRQWQLMNKRSWTCGSDRYPVLFFKSLSIPQMRLWLSRKKNLLDSCCHVTLEMCWRRKLGPHTTTTTPSSTLPSLLGYSRFFVQCCCFLMIETLTFFGCVFLSFSYAWHMLDGSRIEVHWFAGLLKAFNLWPTSPTLRVSALIGRWDNNWKGLGVVVCWSVMFSSLKKTYATNVILTLLT